jgi:hypothetical protein
VKELASVQNIRVKEVASVQKTLSQEFHAIQCNNIHLSSMFVELKLTVQLKSREFDETYAVSVHQASELASLLEKNALFSVGLMLDKEKLSCKQQFLP